jgi:hypothetical protein
LFCSNFHKRKSRAARVVLHSLWFCFLWNAFSQHKSLLLSAKVIVKVIGVGVGKIKAVHTNKSSLNDKSIIALFYQNVNGFFVILRKNH